MMKIISTLCSLLTETIQSAVLFLVKAEISIEEKTECGVFELTVSQFIQRLLEMAPSFASARYIFRARKVYIIQLP